jgi:transcriptional regulator with XRE-family HTH domain
MTLEDYRVECGWSKTEMARQANMDFSTFNKAMNGESISNRTADKLASAISKRLGRPVRIPDIEGLNIAS